MADRPRNPQWEFKPNTPQQIVLVKQWGTGKTGGGYDWFGYEIEIDGVAHTLFAYDQLHAQLKTFAEGSTLLVELKVSPLPNGKVKKAWSVKEAIFDKSGDIAPPPVPKQLVSWPDTLSACLSEAREVVGLYNSGAAESLRLKGEDVRAIVISRVIELSKSVTFEFPKKREDLAEGIPGPKDDSLPF